MTRTMRIALWLLLTALALPAQAQTVVEYIHTDALGTPVAMTRSDRTVVERSEYEPFGALLNRPIQDGPGYTGHVQDAATGLTYMQQRYYDPMIGRFLSVDPVVANGNTGLNFNRYWYANNNPYRFTDPDGRESVGEMIDRNAIASADAERGIATYGWAFLGVTWKYLGAESVSQVADKGSSASGADKAGAVLQIATLNAGKLLTSVGKEVAQGVSNIVIKGFSRHAVVTCRLSSDEELLEDSARSWV